MTKLKLKNRENIFSIILMLMLIGLTIIMCIDLIPLLENIVSHIKDEKEVTSDIYSYGAKGVFILMTLQALQVITTIFPSAAVQILAGLTYGIFYGMLICLAGYMLGNTMVFVFVRQIDKTFEFTVPKLSKRVSKPKWDFSFISDSSNAALVAFTLFLMPGIPNGILPYIFAKTKISLPRYLLSILLAGAPSILLCSLVGERIANGDIVTAVLISCIMLLTALFVFVSRNQIIAFLKKHDH